MSFEIVRKGLDGDQFMDVCYSTVHWRIFVPEGKQPYSGGAKDRCNTANHTVEGICEDPQIIELVKKLDAELVQANRARNAILDGLDEDFRAERRLMKRTRYW